MNDRVFSAPGHLVRSIVAAALAVALALAFPAPSRAVADDTSTGSSSDSAGAAEPTANASPNDDAAPAAARTEPGSSSFAPSEAAASPDTSRVVRVGYMDNPGLLTRNEDGAYSGYTYDYLVQVAQYTGWVYEFVEATGATENERATNLIALLDSGQVDIEGNMAYSEALAEVYEYPTNSYGTVHTALFVPDGTCELTQSNLFTKGEIRVALYRNASKRRGELEYFCKSNGLKLVTVECDSIPEMQERVLAGEAEAFLDVDVNLREGFHVAATFAARPFFFAALHGQRELIDELDATIQRIEQGNPSLQTQLYNKYFMSSDEDFTLSPEELEFARTHDTLRVGILSEKPPIQAFDETTGELEGVTRGMLDYLEEHAGLTFEIVRIERSDDMAAAIRAADVDMVAGIDAVYSAAASLGLSVSAPYLAAASLIVYNRAVSPDDFENARLAVPWELSSVAKQNENAAVFGTLEECFDAVESGRADYTFANSYTATYYLNTSGATNLLTLPRVSQSVGTSFGLTKPVEPELLLIINKSIRALNSTQMDSIVYDSALIDQNEQIGQFVREHRIEIALAAIAVLVLIIVLLVLYLRTRIRAASRVHEENQRYQKLYDLANEQFFEYQIKTDRLMVGLPKKGDMELSGAAERSVRETGLPYEIVDGASKLIERDAGSQMLAALTAPENEMMEVRFEPEGANARWLRITSQTVSDGSGNPISVIGKITNIDDEVRERERLSKRAHHDGLTELLNWETFRERAGALLASGKAGALLIVDADDFKTVNDTYGHPTGDLALQRTADVLRSAFRPRDLVGRLGGDEFAVCINGRIDHDLLEKRCSEIVTRGVYFTDQSGQNRRVSFSVGGVETQGAAAAYRDAYLQADRALYRAKAEGKSRCVLDPLVKEGRS